jgi:hydrogenase expression/formation protein HypE
MLGKVDSEILKRVVFSRLGARDKDVVVGPRYGEDSAAIKIDGRFLVASADPLVFAESRIGQLSVNIACNDVAVCGARPRWLLSVITLPERKLGALDRITEQIDRETKKLGVRVIGGHTEVVPEISRPFLSMTCMGLCERYVYTSGARSGDDVILTKGAGIEATGILATDFKDELIKKGVSDNDIRRAESKLGELSVVRSCLAVSGLVNSMHDPTEGGVLGGALEVSRASGRDLDLWEERIHVDRVTRRVCGAMGINPLKVFASGALLATAKRGEAVVEELGKIGVRSNIIGKVGKRSKSPRLLLHRGRRTEEIGEVRDELYDLWK